MKHLFVLLVCLTVLAAVPAQAADYPPGIMYSTMLNGLTIRYDNGKLMLDNIQAVFLPDPDNSEYQPYNPLSGAAVWTILSNSAGEELYRFDWYASVLTKPYWLLDSYDQTNLRTGETTNSGFFELPVGDYVLDFYLDSGKFYTYGFTVSKVAADDPFGGDDWWYIDGPWEDWAYFYYRDAKPDQSLYFKVWLRHKAHELNYSVKPMLKVFRGGELVCTSREYTSYNLQPSWNRYEMDLIFPMDKTSGGAYFKAKDLVGTDGSYTAKLYLDDALYGEWDFRIEGGQFNYTGRTVRGEADPLTFIEGGRDAWWYERK